LLAPGKYALLLHAFVSNRDPLYVAAVVGTLALTLGASTAVFSIVNGVLLRPLPHPNPVQLVSLREVVPQWTRQYPTLPGQRPAFRRMAESRDLVRVDGGAGLADDEPDRRWRANGAEQQRQSEPRPGHNRLVERKAVASHAQNRP
jgi:hypothetical protein